MIGTSNYVKSIRIWSYSRPYLPAFGLDTARYGVSLRIQSECRKIRARITPNTDTFHAVSVMKLLREVTRTLTSLYPSLTKYTNCLMMATK